MKRKRTKMSYIKSERLKIQMPKKFYNKFLDVLMCQSNYKNEKIITHYVTKELDRIGANWEIDAVGNILVTKGYAEIYPFVASHLDTVHDFVNDFTIKEDNGILTAWSGTKQAGIGGDDKCGVYACLYLIEKYDNIKATFFTSEEVGTIGANKMDLSFFDNVGYAIEIDRKGYGDFIDKYGSDLTTNGEYDLAVEDILIKYGYKSEFGLSTDVLTLFERSVGICCVNLSCGYYNPHRAEEYINVNEFWKSVSMVDEMIQALGETRYEQKPEVRTYNYGNTYGYGSTGTKYDWYEDEFGTYATSTQRRNANVNPNYVGNVNQGYENRDGRIYQDGVLVKGGSNIGSILDDEEYTGDERDPWDEVYNKKKNDVIVDNEYGTWYRLPD